MNTLEALAHGEANRHRELMVFDWEKAARRIVETGAMDAGAGLSGDWEWTGGPILRDGKPVPREDTYTYLASTWATPELTLDGGNETPCFRMRSETPGWDSGTYWPPEALAILRADPAVDRR